MRIPQRRYSETLRKLAPILAQHRDGQHFLRILVAHERQSGMDAEYDIAEAVYWFGSHFYSGQWCPLYAALCATEFQPGPCSNGPEKGSLAEIIYNELAGLLQ